MARTPSPTKISKRLTSADPRERLMKSNIFIERGKPIPTALQQLVQRLMASREDESPNAKIVVKRQPGALMLKEADAIDALQKELLFESARMGGPDFIEVCRNENLERAFLPPTPTTVLNTQLEQAQPDMAVGYLKQSVASAWAVESPFTAQESLQLSDFAPCANLHAPFLTAQFKGAKSSNDNLTVAENQGARDGATLVNFLRWLYQIADSSSSEPGLQETCHFSITCDFTTLGLWIHWARNEDGVVLHFMSQIDVFLLQRERDMKEFRTFTRNLGDYALDTRLKRIRSAIPNVAAALLKKPSLLPRSPPESSSAVSVSGVPCVAGSSIAADPMLPPPTPTSNTASNSGSPPLKRARTQTFGD
jgi:hypothetical protein